MFESHWTQKRKLPEECWPTCCLYYMWDSIDIKIRETKRNYFQFFSATFTSFRMDLLEWNRFFSEFLPFVITICKLVLLISVKLFEQPTNRIAWFYLWTQFISFPIFSDSKRQPHVINIQLPQGYPNIPPLLSAVKSSVNLLGIVFIYWYKIEMFSANIFLMMWFPFQDVPYICPLQWSKKSRLKDIVHQFVMVF